MAGKTPTLCIKRILSCTTFLDAAKCLNLMGCILRKHFAFVWLVNICIFRFFFFASRERFIINQCSSNHVWPQTAASNMHWVLLRCCLIFRNYGGISSIFNLNTIFLLTPVVSKQHECSQKQIWLHLFTVWLGIKTKMDFKQRSPQSPVSRTPSYITYEAKNAIYPSTQVGRRS